MAKHSEEIGMARSIEQSPWEAYEALIESILKNADHDFWDSGSDIEAVAYVRHLEGEVERLRAELRTTVADHSEEIASLCEHGSMACPDCDGVDDVRSVGQVIHGVECYEAWRDGHDCPHEQEEGE